MGLLARIPYLPVTSPIYTPYKERETKGVLCSQEVYNVIADSTQCGLLSSNH